MIDPAEIKQQALKWWKPFLQSEINNQPFFPKQIDRIGKIKPSQVLNSFNSLQEQVTNLYAQSKTNKGYGYVVKTAQQNFRRTGSHELPDAVVFETADDFIQFIGKTKEWKTFLSNKKIIEQTIPSLQQWMVNNPETLTYGQINWRDILKVCIYFLSSPRPQLYIRQLPIDVHTKFVEENETLFRSLFDFLIPGHIRDSNEKIFAKRYFLNYDENLVRIRILDASFTINHLADLSIRLSDFHKVSLDCTNILLAENKMNFLALPPLEGTVAIWSGGGFNVSYLKDVEWLKSKNIFYWGDMDIQGFQILHQMRSYFPQTKSVMMDQTTYDTFNAFQVEGKKGPIENLSLLTGNEREVFRHLKENNLRLEQEKIAQLYADECLRRIINENAS